MAQTPFTDFPARYWSKQPDGRLRCEICPRYCVLKDNQRGMCFVRQRKGGQMILDTYGRSSGFCIDPIEKKPLNHFLPGTPVLSFGTAGCNLACKFCQNHEMSKSRQTDTLASVADPEMLANAARNSGCSSIAYTYNDPVIFLEYAVDVAQAAQERNVANVAVTAGYIAAKPREEFFRHMDAANIDLKAFSERFYRKVTGSELAPVLETIEYTYSETKTHIELTCLLIPDENDSDAEISKLCNWMLDRLGPEVPLHFTAFHPDFRMLSTPRTPAETLLNARAIARAAGLHHVYVGNISHLDGQSSYCAGCSARVIARNHYELSEWHLDDFGKCTFCQTPFPGRIKGPPGTWGRKRKPIRIV